MKQVGIDGDCVEFRMKRDEERRAIEEAAKRGRWHRIRSWFFTPRGALVYFATGYGLAALFFVWWRS